jgi:DNA ligase 1
MTVVRPMLAQAITEDDLPSLQYPLGVQVKYDGIRGILLNGTMISRSGKPLPNLYVQQRFQALYKAYPQLQGLDGEFIVGMPTDAHVCMQTTSGIMSQAGCPAFTFYAFDLANPQYANAKYDDRWSYMYQLIERLPDDFRYLIEPVSTVRVDSAHSAMSHIDKLIGDGLEGAILRNMSAPYKFGRSTLKQGYLLKFKDIREAEAIVVGFEELHRNENESFTDQLGFTKRSAHQENKVAADMLGALVCVSPLWEGEFRIGTGFDVETRKALWANRSTGLIVKFKYLAAGMKDLPRHPSFMSFRAAGDVDPVLLTNLQKKAVIYHAKRDNAEAAKD